MIQLVRKIFSRENEKKRGQGVMEYLIISSLIGIFCLLTVKQFGQVVRDRIAHMKEVVSTNIDQR